MNFLKIIVFVRFFCLFLSVSSMERGAVSMEIVPRKSFEYTVRAFDESVSNSERFNWLRNKNFIESAPVFMVDQSGQKREVRSPLRMQESFSNEGQLKAINEAADMYKRSHWLQDKKFGKTAPAFFLSKPHEQVKGLLEAVPEEPSGLEEVTSKIAKFRFSHGLIYFFVGNMCFLVKDREGRKSGTYSEFDIEIESS
jgi:hypothetical protein